jgi:hypothetical protein
MLCARKAQSEFGAVCEPDTDQIVSATVGTSLRSVKDRGCLCALHAEISIAFAEPGMTCDSRTEVSISISKPNPAAALVEEFGGIVRRRSEFDSHTAAGVPLVDSVRMLAVGMETSRVGRTEPLLGRTFRRMALPSFPVRVSRRRSS